MTLVTNKDFDLKFTRMSSGDIKIKKDIPEQNKFPSIEQSLVNILLTNKGEKPFFQNFGGNMYGNLFELISDIEYMSIPDEINIKETIRLTIAEYEPRVVVTDVQFIGDGKNRYGKGSVTRATDNNQLNIEIKYKVPPATEVFDYTLKVKRVR